MHRSEPILRYKDGHPQAPSMDDVAIEQPLEIRIEGEPLAVAMRTPGHDRELVAGWLLAEKLVQSPDEIAEIVTRPGDDPRFSMADVMLRKLDTQATLRHRRAAVSNASCGLCGAASVEQVLRDFPKIESSVLISASTLLELPSRLLEVQSTFRKTGGLHACATFDLHGKLLEVREDVGRHNALDKLLGHALLEGRLPLSQALILLSGRVSFEMMQKALAAGAPVVAAIGAPSSLAIDLARSSGQTLVAFLRGTTFNVYAGKQRIRGVGAI